MSFICSRRSAVAITSTVVKNTRAALAGLALILLLAGCSTVAAQRIAGVLSYARIYASKPKLLLGEVVSLVTKPARLQTIESKAVLEEIASGHLKGAFVRDVPFYAQTEYGCGPAALASVLTYLDVDVDLREITNRIVSPEIRGTRTSHMAIYPLTRGLWSEWHAGSADLLLERLSCGQPVICLLGAGGTGFAGHYVVVRACAAGRGVVCHNGCSPDVFMKWELFDAFWAASKRWMLTVCKPENARCPIPLAFKSELQQVLDSKEQWAKALKIYADILLKKANRLEEARLTYNKGIAHFAAGEPGKAQEAFSKALELEPNLPDAANALAYTWATLGKNLEEAEELARKALTAGARNTALYLDTLGFVLHRLGCNMEATRTLREAAAKAPPGDEELLAEIHYHLGLSSVSDPGTRREALGRAVQLDPEGQWGRRALALLGMEKGKAGKSP